MWNSNLPLRRGILGPVYHPLPLPYNTNDTSPEALWRKLVCEPGACNNVEGLCDEPSKKVKTNVSLTVGPKLMEVEWW